MPYIELINISFAPTAASLSELTGDLVVLEQPDVYIHALIFTGSVSGDALLLLDYQSAVIS